MAEQTKRFLRAGIQLKWALLGVVAVGLALIPAAGIMLTLVRQEMELRARQAAEAIATQLADSSAEPILAGDDLALARGVTTAMKQADVIMAVVFKPDGTVLASSNPACLIGSRVDKLTERAIPFAEMFGLSGPQPVESFVPVTVRFPDRPPQTVGFVRVGYSFDRAAARVRSFTVQLLLLTVLGLAVGVAMCAILARSFAKPVLRLTDFALTVAKGDFSVSSDIKRSDELGTLADAFNVMTKFLRNGQFFRHAFERYVSPELAEHMARDPRTLLPGFGTSREVTVLFMDIRGFTALSETMTARDVVSFLTAFFNMMSKPVFAAEGAIDKFIGDAMMAVFGFPIAHGDDPLRAVEAAVDMQRAVKAYNEERARFRLAPVGIGVGINTGVAVAGSVGCDRKLDFTVIGDTVNVASRLCGLAAAGEVLVSESTYGPCSRYTTAEPRGEQKVKGRAQPVSVYSVTAITRRHDRALSTAVSAAG